ncbi:MAG TPA: hypothetical protein VM261_07220 [Kofleriaceae bacterium]|nr:hypothetical protein [Kofleriaceae bacterium]
MTGPYRELPVRRDAPRGDADRDPEATIIHALVATLGAGRLAVVLGLHEAFGWEATLALVFGIIGVAGLTGPLLRR